MREKVEFILITLLSVFAFILFFGFVLSHIDPDNKLEAYTLAVSFASIFTTFGGAYLGAKISGIYAIKVANKELEEYKQEQKFLRNVYIRKYIRFNSVVFSKVNGIYTSLKNILDDDEAIDRLYNSKEGALIFPEDSDGLKLLELYDFIYELNKIITNIVNNEKCIVADDKYTNALLRMQYSAKHFLNAFKREEIIDYKLNYFKNYLNRLMDTCEGIINEYNNFWDR